MAGEDESKEKYEQSKLRSTDPRSPYYIGSQDNPGVVITQVQLKGENYEEWAKAIRNALRAKKKLGFIDGKIDKPTDEADLEDWFSINALLVAWILNTIESSLCSTVAYVENARDLWEELKQRFSVGNGPRIQQIKSDLANCKQGGQVVV